MRTSVIKRTGWATLASVVALGFGNALPHEAAAYAVYECEAETATTAPDAEHEELGTTQFSFSDRDCGAGSDQALKIKVLGGTSDGDLGLWRFVAPEGARFTGVQLRVRVNNDRGVRGDVVVRGDDGSSANVYAGGDTGGAFVDGGWSAAGGGKRKLLVRLRCELGGGCAGQSDAAILVKRVLMLVSDTTAPTVSQAASGLLAGGWQRGTQPVRVEASDQGGGIEDLNLIADGNLAEPLKRSPQRCALYDSDKAKRLVPCPASVGEELAVDTTRLTDGVHRLRTCAEQFRRGESVSGLTTCTSDAELRIDNHAPQNPQGLTVAGGEGWRPVNRFDLSWTTPADQVAPIEGAHYRLTGPGGYDSGIQVRELPGGEPALGGIEVPQPGEYRLGLWLRDAAGNESEQNSEAVTLRFDDTRPPTVLPRQATGWIARRDLPYRQSWRLDQGPLPPSGIRGYVVKVDRGPDSDPCADPFVCADGELTHHGEHTESATIADLPEGSSWVHVVAVSGAGVRSPAVGHAELRVDKRDPKTTVSGIPDGWVNRPVTVTASATDEHSGMSADPGFPDELPPAVFVQADGDAPVAGPGDRIEHTISSEGDHSVSYWSRDLAGNANDGSEPGHDPGSARVRIDLTPPAAAFASAEDPKDPELLRAPVNDHLSGIDPESGRIGFRKDGSSSDWHPLATELVGGELRARVPSDDLERGERYEFRAEVSDVAGNRQTTSQRADGTRMTLRMPIKAKTKLSVSIDGRRDREVGYGRPATLTGLLRAAGPASVAGQRIEVIEDFAPGARTRSSTRTVRTGPRGEFFARLAPGPSRRVTARFAGTAKLARVSSKPVRMLVRGEASLHVRPAATRAGRRVSFSGRVRHAGAEAEGTFVLVQFFNPYYREWRTFARDRAVRSRTDGLFRLRQQVGLGITAPVRYRFRAVVPRQADWPYLTARSPVRRLTVRP